MKFFKSIRKAVFLALSFVMTLALFYSCETRSKSTPESEEIAMEERVIEDSTFFDLNAKYGKKISNVSDLSGSQMFFNNCELGRYLVAVDSISIYRNPENGVVQIGRLIGNVVWGDVPWKDIDVDNTERFTELGWEPMDAFANFTIEDKGSLRNIDVQRMTMGTALVNDYEIVVMRDMEGMEYPSNSKVSHASSDLDEIDCIIYKEWDCSNILCSRACEDVGGDCNCPGLGFCSYTLNYRCMVINCKKTCERYWPIGGLAWCSCE